MATTNSLHDVIRPLKERALRSRALRKVPFESRALRSIETVEQIEAALLPYLESLRAAIPQLDGRRRFYDGSWELGLSADLERSESDGRDARAFSRIDFDISIDAATGDALLVCHRTVFDRDLPTEWFGVPAGSPDTEALTTFVETACLGFARRFFDAQSLEAA